MKLKYIVNKFKNCNKSVVLSFLFDIMVHNSDDIEDYNNTKQYVKGDRIFYQNERGINCLKVCIAKEAQIGKIVSSEWIDAVDFAGGNLNLQPKITYNELVRTSTVGGETTFDIDADIIIEESTVINVYHSVKGRLSKFDFSVTDHNLTLNNPY